MTQTDRHKKDKKYKKNSTFVNTGPPDIEYLYYPLDVAHCCQLVQDNNDNKNKNLHHYNFHISVLILLLVLGKKKKHKKPKK